MAPPSLRPWSRQTLQSGVWRWRLWILLRGLIGLALAAGAALMVILASAGGAEDAAAFETGLGLPVAVGALSLLAEYIDSSVGMGYGAVVAPVLIVTGFPAADVLAAVLLSEAITGVVAGVLHHRAGNVDLAGGSRDRRIAWFMALPAAAAAAGAATAATTLEVEAAEVAIGLVALVAGGFVLGSRRLLGGFSWRKVGALGVTAAAAKGLGGSGFGPIATAGLIGVGVPERNSVGVTSLAEGLASACGLAVFVAVEGWPPLRLVGTLLVGGLLAVPAAVWTVRLLPGRVIRLAVGGATCFLGLMAIVSVAVG